MGDPSLDADLWRKAVDEVYGGGDSPTCEICGGTEDVHSAGELPHLVQAFTGRDKICRSCIHGLGYAILLGDETL